MEDLHSVWLRVHKAAWWLTPSYAAAPFLLQIENGGCPQVQPLVILVQALAKHIEPLVALPDDLLEETIAQYLRLCVACGCHTARELTSWLATEALPHFPLLTCLWSAWSRGTSPCLSFIRKGRERDE